MTWIFVRAQRSLIPGMIIHAGSNIMFFFLTQLWMPGRPAVSTAECLGAMCVAALVVLVAGRRTLFGRTAIAPTAGNDPHKCRHRGGRDVRLETTTLLPLEPSPCGADGPGDHHDVGADADDR
jgi:hypothetical protein